MAAGWCAKAVNIPFGKILLKAAALRFRATGKFQNTRQDAFVSSWIFLCLHKLERVSVQNEMTETHFWDAAEHLKTEEDMVAYLDAALEDGEPS